MSVQFKHTDQKSNTFFAGIDVGAEELFLVIRKNGTPYKAQKFSNSSADRARLVKKLTMLEGPACGRTVPAARLQSFPPWLFSSTILRMPVRTSDSTRSPVIGHSVDG